jgi:hypothetical protein
VWICSSSSLSSDVMDKSKIWQTLGCVPDDGYARLCFSCRGGMLLRLLSKPLGDGALLDSRVEPTLMMLDFGDEWRFWRIQMCPRAFLYFLFFTVLFVSCHE